MQRPRLPFPFLIALVLAIVLGFLLGRLFTLHSLQKTPMTLEDDTRPKIPVVRIDGSENGNIVGTIEGEARFFVEDKPVTVQGGSFRVPLTSLRSVVTLRVPPGMQFAASKQGTKYYPIDAPPAQRLSPANVIFFRTAEEAEAAGFRP